MKIVICTSYYEEIKPLVLKLDKSLNKEEDNNYTYKNHTFVLTTTGIGKIKSSYGILNIIRSYNPDIILFYGTSGRINNKLKYNDVLIPHTTEIYDSVYYSGDQILNSRQYPTLNINKNMNLLISKNQLNEFDYFAGKIITGDSIILDKTKRQKLYDEYNADAVDMETYAVNYVCQREKIPIISIKIISDIDDINMPELLKRNELNRSEIKMKKILSLNTNEINSFKDKYSNSIKKINSIISKIIETL